MSASAATVLMPDAELAWKLWRSLAGGKSETLDSPSEFRQSSKPVVVGLPATACRTVGLILPAVDAALLPSMVEAQLERRGIQVTKEPSPNFAWHLIGQDAAHTFVSVDVLAQPFPENLAVNQAANYTAALRLMALPSRDLILVEEQGQLVLTAAMQGRLWHSHIIGASETSAEDLAREIDLAKLSLEALDGFGAVRGVTLVGDRLAPLRGELKKFTATPVEFVSNLDANRGLKLDTFQKLLPQTVYEAQASRARRKRFISIGIVMVILYAAAFAGCWWYLNTLRDKVTVLEKHVAETEAPANEVKDTAARWRSLEPAIDKDRYPLMQLTTISELMPPSGVVIRQFSSKPNEIEITADARDAQTATQFFEDLSSHAKLKRFTWTKTTPTVKDKIASFKIQGKLDSK